jgi:hypothetical protein
LKPVVAAGVLTAVVTGGVMAALTVSAGGLASSLPAIAALTAALVAGGVFYGWLIQAGRLRVGFGPGILFWIVAFPFARLAQEWMVPGGGGAAGLGQGIASFLVFQAMVGGAFGLGFVLLHNQIWGWLSAGSER